MTGLSLDGVQVKISSLLRAGEGYVVDDVYTRTAQILGLPRDQFGLSRGDMILSPEFYWRFKHVDDPVWAQFGIGLRRAAMERLRPREV